MLFGRNFKVWEGLLTKVLQQVTSRGSRTLGQSGRSSDLDLRRKRRRLKRPVGRVERIDLLQSEQRFDALVSGVEDYAIFLLSPKGYIISWNAGAERIKGYKPEEIIGKHFSVFLHAGSD